MLLCNFTIIPRLEWPLARTQECAERTGIFNSVEHFQKFANMEAGRLGAHVSLTSMRAVSKEEYEGYLVALNKTTQGGVS